MFVMDPDFKGFYCIVIEATIIRGGETFIHNLNEIQIEIEWVIEVSPNLIEKILYNVDDKIEYQLPSFEADPITIPQSW